MRPVVRLEPLPEVVFFQEGPGLRKWQWTDDGMKVINVTNILGDDGGTVDVTNTDKYISLVEFEEKYQHFAVDNGDFVVASSGNTYGKVGKITEQCLPLMMNTSVIRFHSLDSERLDNNFLYAFLRSPDFLNQVEQFVIGGAQPNFGPTHLKKMSIPLPGITTQRRIGKTVSSYDDLIENNQRRIKLLEQSARLLYKEWFVHLRYPGHEHLKVKDGTPDGWEKKSLGEMVEIKKGKNITAETTVEGDVPVVAGGLTPAYFHNIANVVGPVITVSASGANAGFVNLYHENIWASDCSYIGSDATDYIYDCATSFL